MAPCKEGAYADQQEPENSEGLDYAFKSVMADIEGNAVTDGNQNEPWHWEYDPSLDRSSVGARPQ